MMSANTNSLVYPAYYDRLRSYFPEQELKPIEQLEDLLAHSAAYQRMETPEFLILYAEFLDFIFVDYFLVDASLRGQGIGSEAMQHLQSRNKVIVLEIEPQNPTQPDTILRRKFYLRHGFQSASEVVFRRQNASGEPFDMEILIWTPDLKKKAEDETALRCMIQVCENVHNFHAQQHYDRIPAAPNKVLWLRK